jgi:hypothetical protein
LGFLFGIAVFVGIGYLVMKINESMNSDNNPPRKSDQGNKEKPITGINDKLNATNSESKKQVLSLNSGLGGQADDSKPRTTEDLLRIIRNRKGYLLHVTEYENVSTILIKGILSMEQIRKSGISPRTITGNLSQSLDGRKGTTNYVHLAYDESYSIFGAKIYRSEIHNPALIKIDPRIIKEKNCLFTDRNATANDSAIGNPNEVLSRLDFEKIYCPMSTIASVGSFRYYKQYKQAEILVEGFIPTEYIVEIVLPVSANLQIAIPPHIKISYADTVKMLSYDLGTRWY